MNYFFNCQIFLKFFRFLKDSTKVLNKIPKLKWTSLAFLFAIIGILYVSLGKEFLPEGGQLIKGFV